MSHCQKIDNKNTIKDPIIFLHSLIRNNCKNFQEKKNLTINE